MNLTTFFQLFGGIGLFLLGMSLLSSGLKAYAGDALRRALIRFTGSPAKAFTSGALVTALVQSSSATTVTVIGFVSAGLLTFPQAVGVVIGASLGTTTTGWIVAGLGLKVSIALYALPIIGVGAFLNLLGRNRWKAVGEALAGFGLIFVGLEVLKEGMAGLTQVFDLASLPHEGLWGHAIVITVGVVMTVIMQSSSAATATTLTALHSNSINFEQATLLVIGAAVGTTITGVLAAIGGSVAAKRTAAAHVSFNLATGVIAALLLPLFIRGIAWAQQHLGLDPGALSLAAFHTSFIAVGVLIFLPLADRFARAIEWLLPERGPRMPKGLDNTVLHVPAVALEATKRALRETAVELFAVMGQSLGGVRGAVVTPPPESDLADPPSADLVRRWLALIQQFMARVPSLAANEPMSRSRVAQVHALDHLLRLLDHAPPSDAVTTALNDPLLLNQKTRTRDLLELASRGLSGQEQPGWLQAVESGAREVAELRQRERPHVIETMAAAGVEPASTLALLDAMRWMEKVAYHAWRISHHLGTTPESLRQPAHAIAAQPEPRTDAE